MTGAEHAAILREIARQVSRIADDLATKADTHRGAPEESAYRYGEWECRRLVDRILA